MALISNCQMIEITPQRFEKKYSFSLYDLERFESWQSGCGIVFHTAYPERVVNNIYFESPEWENHSENLAGISQRSKCRLRWYGETTCPTKTRFEVKRRRNSIGDKLVQRISRGHLQLDSGGNHLYKELRSLLEPEIRIILDQNNHPILFNRYYRQYYSTKDSLRLTVDTKLQFKSLSNSSVLNNQRFVRSGIFGFVEVKYSVGQELMVEHHLKNFPLRATRNSKYVIGINHLYG